MSSLDTFARRPEQRFFVSLPGWQQLFVQGEKTDKLRSIIVLSLGKSRFALLVRSLALLSTFLRRFFYFQFKYFFFHNSSNST